MQLGLRILGIHPRGIFKMLRRRLVTPLNGRQNTQPVQCRGILLSGLTETLPRGGQLPGMKLGDPLFEPMRELVVPHRDPQFVKLIRRLACIDPECRKVGIPVVPLEIQPREI